jgi:hypothetical protein
MTGERDALLSDRADTDAHDHQAARALFGLGRAQNGLNMLSSAHESLERAFDLFDKAGDVPSAVAVVAVPVPYVARPRMARMSERALELVTRGSREEGILIARHAGMMDRAREPQRSQQEFARTIEIARRHGDA